MMFLFAVPMMTGLGIYLEYVATNSARVVSHFYSAFPSEFQFVN